MYVCVCEEERYKNFENNTIRKILRKTLLWLKSYNQFKRKFKSLFKKINL